MSIKKSSVVFIIKRQISDAIYWRQRLAQFKKEPAFVDRTHWVLGRYGQAIDSAKLTAKLLREGQ